MKKDKLSDEIPRSDREELSLYKKAGKINQFFLDNLLNFIQEKWGLLPRESDELQICFKPQFVAFVSANKNQGGVRVSLFGTNFTSGKVESGKYLNWRTFSVCHSDELSTARLFIEEAYENRAHAPRKLTIREEYESI